METRSSLLSLLEICAVTLSSPIKFTLARVFLSLREAPVKRWKKEKSSPLRRLAQLESKFKYGLTVYRGYVIDDLDTSHYMKDFHAQKVPLRNPKAKALLSTIEQNFGTLAFCRRWLDEVGFDKHLIPLKNLVDSGIVNPYPPLSDVPGCFVA